MRAYGKMVDTWYAALSAELPGNGWPLGRSWKRSFSSNRYW
ncbi:hypothetical protein [Caballeronia zhejiangensis]